FRIRVPRLRTALRASDAIGPSAGLPRLLEPGPRKAVLRIRRAVEHAGEIRHRVSTVRLVRTSRRPGFLFRALKPRGRLKPSRPAEAGRRKPQIPPCST